MEVSFKFWLHVAQVGECLDACLADALEVVLGHDTGDVLLVSELALHLSGLLLNSSPVDFGLDSTLGCFHSLSFDQLGVSDLFIFLLLFLHYLKLLFLEDLHAGLLESLEHEHVEHWLDFLLEVKELNITIKDLGGLAVLLCWHLWLEEGNGRSIEIELSCDSLLVGRWLVSQLLDVLIGLSDHMITTWNWLRSGDVPIRVLLNNALRSL